MNANHFLSLRVAALVGENPATLRATEQVERALKSARVIGVMGETGTAKAELARAIWQHSPHAEHPFVSFNCTACSPADHGREIIGSDTSPVGLVRQAAGGVLLISHADQLAKSAQAPLLALAEEHQVLIVLTTDRLNWFRQESASSSASSPSLPDAPFAAEAIKPTYAAPESSSNPSAWLSGVSHYIIELSPLRSRSTDIPELLSYYLNQLASRVGRRISRIHPDAMEALYRYHWPGNVHELSSVVHRAMLSANADEIRLEDLPRELQQLCASSEPASGVVRQDAEEILNLRELERRTIHKALERTGGCMSHAAKLLGIGRATIYRKLASFANETEQEKPTVSEQAIA